MTLIVSVYIKQRNANIVHISDFITHNEGITKTSNTKHTVRYKTHFTCF